MKNSVSTNVVKLDLKVILKNYKDPRFWQKKWPIIDTKEIKIVWYISNIDTIDNKINSYLKVTYKNFKRGNKKLGDWWYCNESVGLPPIPISNKEYTQQHFDNALYHKTIELLEDVERHMIYEYAEYKNAEKTQEQVKAQLREIASKFLDDLKIENEDVREAYIDKYVDEQYAEQNVSRYTAEVVENYKHKVITESYVYAAAWFNREEEYNKYNDVLYNDHEKKSIGFKIWNTIKEIQTEKWQKSMKEQLRSL